MAFQFSRKGCFKCGNLGHIAENCSSEQRLCYNCRQPGHESSACPSPRTVSAKQCYSCGGVGHIQELRSHWPHRARLPNCSGWWFCVPRSTSRKVPQHLHIAPGQVLSLPTRTRPVTSANKRVTLRGTAPRLTLLSPSYLLTDVSRSCFPYLPRSISVPTYVR
ncbi:hypothetical protein BDZ89DRAFT_6633 [Hymenopellis radicata]|nr:hypothetical protein BDZ89DRAFT_6633 [Hymenopellis radicata]